MKLNKINYFYFNFHYFYYFNYQNHPFVVKNQPDQNEFAQWVKKVNDMKISDEKR